jgi:hypothetical protein
MSRLLNPLIRDLKPDCGAVEDYCGLDHLEGVAAEM